MSVINRYSSPSVAMYNPLSMQELAFAPTFLRQRHDQAAQALSDLGIQSNQYDVLDQYGTVANQLVTPLQEQISSLSENLAKQGIQRSNAIPQAMKLKSEYANMFGASGGIGQLQNATKQYRAQAEEIKKFFEKNPELARGAISELRPGEATLKDGRLQLGQSQTPNYVRHYDAKEINDILNNQVDNIKDTLLKDYGFQNVGNISTVQDVYMQGQKEGRTFEEVDAILRAQLSPEIIRSAQQYGKYALGDAELGEKLLYQQIRGAAVGRASEKMNTSYSVVTNEDRKYNRENLISNWAYDSLPGVATELDPSTQKIYKDASVYEKVLNNMSTYTETGRDGKLKVRVDGNGNPLSKGDVSKLGQNASVKLVDFVDFESIKNSSDRFKNMSTKDFVNLYSNYITDVNKNFDKAVVPVGENMSWLQERVVGNKGKEGLISLRQIRTPEGGSENFNTLLKQAGYSDLTDFYENSGASVKGYSPSTGSYAVTYRDSGGKPKTFYIEADSALKSATVNTMQMSALAKSGTPFVALNESANLNIPGTENYVKYFVNDYKGGIDGSKLVLAPAGLSESQIVNNLDKYVAIPLSKIRMAEQQSLQSDPALAKYFK
jgi:hypothetical protein